MMKKKNILKVEISIQVIRKTVNILNVKMSSIGFKEDKEKNK